MSKLIPVGSTEVEAKKKCIKLSKQNTGMYVYAVAAFGLFALIQKRLPVFAPSGTPFNWYILNGTVKQFTEAQVIADQNATPILN
jgi:hypothetical protein